MRVRRPAASILPAIALALCSCTPPSDGPPADELAARVKRARPSWEDYGEDLKAALGATSVARWSGRLRLAEIEGDRVRLAFELDPPWRDYKFGMPVLIRDPLGRVHGPLGYTEGVYEFNLDGLAPGAVISGIEVRFPPNEERRIAFDRTGRWTAQRDR